MRIERQTASNHKNRLLSLIPSPNNKKGNESMQMREEKREITCKGLPNCSGRESGADDNESLDGNGAHFLEPIGGGGDNRRRFLLLLLLQPAPRGRSLNC